MWFFWSNFLFCLLHNSLNHFGFSCTCFKRPLLSRFVAFGWLLMLDTLFCFPRQDIDCPFCCYPPRAVRWKKVSSLFFLIYYLFLYLLLSIVWFYVTSQLAFVVFNWRYIMIFFKDEVSGMFGIVRPTFTPFGCSFSLLSTTLFWLTKQDGLNRACKMVRGSFWSFWTFNWAALSIACYAIGCQNLTANSLNTTCSCGYRLFVESYPFSEPWVKTMFALTGFLDYFVVLWMVTRLDCDSISPEAKQQITLILFKLGMRGISQKF